MRPARLERAPSAFVPAIRRGRPGLAMPRERTMVALPARVCEAIDAYLAQRPDPTTGPLFATRTRRRLSRFEAAGIVARVARLAGITKRISPHSLRHSAITAALDAG